MHCNGCNRLLTDYESTRKNAVTGQYFDLCKVCFEDIKPFVSVIDRKDLITEADLDHDEDEDGDNLSTGASLELEDLIIDTIENSRDYDEH